MMTVDEVVKIIKADIDKFNISKSDYFDVIHLSWKNVDISIDKHNIIFGTGVKLTYREKTIAEHSYSHNRELRKIYKILEEKFRQQKQNEARKEREEIERLKFELKSELGIQETFNKENKDSENNVSNERGHYV